MDRLSSRVAIITGGARGMGEATVRLFVEQGANVVIGDVLDEPGQRLADSLGERCRYQHLDVTSEENWTRVVDYAVAEFGRVDVLVNNAGILHIASVRDTTAADYQKVIAVNQVGPFLGIKAVLDVMKGQGAGSIINISSLEGLQSKNGLIAYSSTKWAVRGMTKAAAIELGPLGIRVNSVHPGGIHTPMGGATTSEPSEADDAMYQEVPLKRIGRPIEVANMSLFLASDESSYCTGSEFVVDGGWNAGQRMAQLPMS